jgi:hypothetical protein
MPTTLIVSDIHEDLTYLQQAEERAKEVDAVVCLGDYWDSWNGVTEATHVITAWVKEKMHDPKWTLLWGNHDLHYAFDIRMLRCSGYSSLRKSIISPKIRMKDWARLRFHTWVSGWLLTHAGVVPQRAKVPEGQTFVEWMHEQEADIRKALGQGVPHPWLEAGYARSGGWHKGFGGLVWADWSEMGVIPGVNQLVGHTEGFQIRRLEKDGTQSVCMDTQRRHFARIDETGKLKFEQVKD